MDPDSDYVNSRKSCNNTMGPGSGPGPCSGPGSGPGPYPVPAQPGGRGFVVGSAWGVGVGLGIFYTSNPFSN